MKPVIRLERPDDRTAIRDITRRAFVPMPFADGDEQDLIDRFRAAGALAVSLVAGVGGAVAGQVTFTEALAADGSPGWYALGPVAVEPVLQKRHIGSRLIETGLAMLRERDAAGCVLVGDPAYYRRFGDWAGILRGLRDWVAEHAPDFPYGRELERRLANQERRKPRGGVARARSPPERPWGGTGARVWGPRLGFRGLACAPVNGMGVVLVFGMVAADIGYAVDAIGTAFPDCNARRLVAGGAAGRSGVADARWEPVRIEFEFRSRSFFYHGHDADECDVIVCWQHDWPDCPLEVLALEDVVASLAARGRVAWTVFRHSAFPLCVLPSLAGIFRSVRHVVEIPPPTPGCR